MRAFNGTALVDRLNEVRGESERYATDAAAIASEQDACAHRFWRTMADASDLAHDVLHGAEPDEVVELARRLITSLELRLACGDREIVGSTALRVVLLMLRAELRGADVRQ